MPDAPPDVRIGDIHIDFTTGKAMRGGEPIRFTFLELAVLRYLIERRGQTVSRKQLLREVWGYSQDIITRTIDRHMASIRKKIEDDPANPRHIQTVYGVGYRFRD